MRKTPKIVTSDASRRNSAAAQQIDSERLQLLLESENIIPWEADAQTWLFTYVGPQAVTILGYPLEQWYEQDFWTAHIHPEDREAAINFCQESARKGQPFTFEYRFLSSEGKTVWLHDLVSVETVKGTPTTLRGFMFDITDRKKTEGLLKDSEARFRMIYENAPVMIDAFDDNGRCVMFNRECEKVFGWTAEEVFAHENPLKLFYPDPEVQSHVMETVSSKPEKIFRQWKPKRKDGSEAICLWANFKLPDGLVINLGYDITEYTHAEQQARRLQEDLAHVTRVASLGELSASMAHELNQPLTAILTNAQVTQRLLNENESASDDVAGALADIVEAARRARDVIRRLRDLYKHAEPNVQELDINEMVRQVEMLLHSETIFSGVSIQLDLAEGLARTMGDSVQLQQVIINLVLNGLEAMQTVEPDERELLIRTSLNAAGAIKVVVQDKGVGIDVERIDHLFDSFFTTKAGGLGMGLSIARSIVETHGGRLMAVNNPDRGATFSFTLPIRREYGS